MKNLLDFQKNMAKALKQKDSQGEPGLESHAHRSLQQSIYIYRNSMRAALLAVLADTYSVCQKIVGVDFFRAMALLYIDETDSVSPNINDYGASFSEFIAQFPHTQSLGYLADVAGLEWLLHQTHFGEDFQALPVSELIKLNEKQYEQIIFSMPVNSYLLASDYPLYRIWEFNQNEYSEEEVLTLDAQSEEKLLIWRPQFNPEILVLNDLEWQVLSALKSELTLRELCEQFASQANLNIPKLLGEFVNNGWVNQFRCA